MRPRARKALQVMGPFLGLLLVVAIFGAVAPDTFLTAGNFRTVATQTVIPALGALGMTLVIGSGGIDLSAGSQIALASVVCAHGMRAGHGPVLACALAVLATAACGLVSGLVITRLSVVPFIATLGMLGAARGLAKWVSDEQTIHVAPGALVGLMSMEPSPAWLLLAPGVWVVVVLAVLCGLALRRTRFGLHAIAIGSNEATARLCGVPVDLRKVQLYVLLGACCGVSGCLSFARLTIGDPTTAVGMELEIIAAVVIGGASLAGGECSVLGTVVGSLVISLLKSGFNHAGQPQYVQEMVTGAIIVAAVALDRWRGRVGAAS